MAQHLVAGLFNSGDFSHTWIYEYLQAQDLMTAENQFVISTQESDAGWSRQGKKQIHTLPYQSAPGLSVHRFRWRSYWVQADIYGSTRSSQITILIHSCDTSVLLDFIEDARLHYAQASISRVNVHLTDGYASWGRVVTKSRRSFSTLILQDGIKETLVSDVKEFLDNKEWYAFAGVPHRRGYLLFGDPGTGKSTTVHALAGELGMEIYFVSLASPGMNDHSLGELFHSTPPHSILLIEDLDVAFPPRGQDAPEAQTKADEEGRPVEPRRRPRSRVTLAGLLNILDSVASQEGYVLIATTNHIHQLDPALIRPGRIDVQIKYGLAVPEQLENVFHRFYPAENATNPAHPWSAKGTGATTEEIHDMAREFAAAIPESKYSIAQLQGYLLGFKNDPKGAVQGITAWVADREREAKEPKPPQQWESEDDEGYNDDY
ncbi:P-loop containing nucleoside triphosphate hydrolase protein [Mycena filopes]|nr:P-loop containing nucleoside triphosphate hydrolase protein [Mycena filopes]